MWSTWPTPRATSSTFSDPDQGGAFGGWSLYASDGRPAAATTCSASSASRSTGEQPIPAGEHQVRAEFAYDGGGLGKGGTVTLYVDGAKVGEGRVAMTRQWSSSTTGLLGGPNGAKVRGGAPRLRSEHGHAS